MIPHTLDGELLRRKARKDYGTYVELANPGFYMTHFHRYLCDQIQEFLETPCTNGAMDILLLSVPPQHGKGSRKETPVFTPDGWRRHGELSVGDRIYHADGSIGHVTYVHPDYCLDEYEVKFRNGETVQVSPQHLWNVCYSDRSRKQTCTVRKLVETQNIFAQNRYLLERSPYIEVNGILDGASNSLSIDPYILGLWLGDGLAHNGNICGIVRHLREYVDNGVDGEIIEQHDKDYSEPFGYIRNAINIAYLQQYNLIKNKHIPVEYLTASPADRLKLLQGLMDTDGNISRVSAQYELCLANEQLALDAYTLVRSLGYKAQFDVRKTHNQNKDFEGIAYRVLWRVQRGDIMFKLSCKQDIVDDWQTESSSPVSLRYYIKSVKKVASNIVGNCITVDGDGTYLIGEDLIPTHNSFTVTETLPSWFLAKHPTDAVIIAGYESTFAEAFSRRNRDKFNSIVQEVFLQHDAAGNVTYNCKPNNSVQGVALWETEQGGRCRAAGLKAGITGHGAELFIIDDPIKSKEQADSETVIAKIHDEMGPSVQSRIHPGGKLIVIQTRWVENDVIGWIQVNWAEWIWKTINLPAEYDETAAKLGPCPLGRHIGDSLMGAHLGDDESKIPQKIANTNKWLASKKRLVINSDGERTWNALYQGRPSAEKGNLFREDWWKPYKRTASLRDSLEYLQLSIDATFKNTETSDMVAIELWGLKGRDVYLWKLKNKRMGFLDTVRKIKEICKDFPDIDELVIEDKANGSAIIDTLSYEQNIPPIVAVEPKGGKYARAQATSNFVATGVVHIPDDFTDEEDADVEWDGKDDLSTRDKFIYQHSTFPYGRHDDMVDSQTQGLSRILKLITGEIALPAKKRKIRYTKWHKDMWEDFEALDEEGQNEFLAKYGYPEEWQDEDIV